MALSAAQSKEGDKENLRSNIPEAASKHGWMDRETESRREGRKDKKNKIKALKAALASWTSSHQLFGPHVIGISS